MSNDINNILGITNDQKKEANSIQGNHVSNPKLILKIVSAIAVVSIRRKLCNVVNSLCDLFKSSFSAKIL